MPPTLVSIAGPLKGTTFPLEQDEISIGRESTNQIVINDASLSRRHCLLKRNGEQFHLSDLDSLNGTFVNDVPTKERILAHGDCIRLSATHFLFFLRENESSLNTPPVQFDEHDLAANSTIEMRAEDVFNLMARDLHALMKITRTINAVRGAEAIQQQLLELIFEVVPAERGTVLMLENTGNENEEDEETSAPFVWSRGNTDPARPFRVSRTIVRRVFREGISLLSNDLTENSSLQAVESLDASATRSLLCVPLTVHERAIGVIYLEASNLAARFTEDQLTLVIAIANVAAVALENARHMAWLESENQRLRSDARLEHNMIGESAAMRDVYQFISRVALSDSTVLIRGESGTGKELAARAIHLNSARNNRPFIAINCAALTETLLESELFGHEKGAFTGAVTQKKGKLEAGDGGTVFLDEVGELPLALQAKLLRALQEREFDRVGGTRPVKVNIRILAATNRSLEEAIKGGEFRADLYYRLNVVSINLPSLRERREDISLLTSYFVAKHATRCNRKLRGVSPEARAVLTRYDWPGNVRELENAIERAIVLGTSDLIRPEDLPETLLEAELAGESNSVITTKYHDAMKELKKQLIIHAVEEANGNYTEAAKALGVHPNYLHRLIRNLQLKESLKPSTGER